MKPEHAEWIEQYAQRHGGWVRGHCVVAAREMASAFEGLEVVPGFVQARLDPFDDLAWHEHAWCVAADGEIVDPTAAQFCVLEAYRPFQPGDAVRVGRCMECGTVIRAAVLTLEALRRGARPSVESHPEEVRLIDGATSVWSCSEACSRALEAM